MVDLETRDRYNITYNLWKSMVWAANNRPTPNNQICDTWDNYDNFYIDMGARPSIGHMLTRPNDGQELGSKTCTWAKIPEPKPKPIDTGKVKEPKLFTTKGFLDHGIGTRDEPEYGVWLNMIQRCFNPKASGYSAYKDRQPGVDWLSYDNFKRDMGARPSNLHSLDRVDNEQPYSKDNCEWVTGTAQSRNRSTNRLVTLAGITKCVVEWSEDLGIPSAVITSRLNTGWSDSEALEVDPEKLAAIKSTNYESALKKTIERNSLKIVYKGKTQSLKEWCRELDLNYFTVKTRSRKNLDRLFRPTPKNFEV